MKLLTPMHAPMNAKIGSEKDLERKDMLFEPKLDGIRALCKVTSSLKFISRNGIDITKKYPEFQFRDDIAADTALLDGEIVVFDENMVPRFELWQQGYEALYVVFDILRYNGKNLTKVPLIERKELLDSVVTDGTHLEKCFYTTDGPALWKEMVKREFEGVMAKEKESLYYPGKRSKVWLKIKLFKSLEAVIIGYTSKKRALSSLVLGIYDDTLKYVGRVGTGFDQATIDMLLKKLKPLIRKTPYAKSYLSISKADTITWVRPKLVAEVKYLEFTKQGILRSPVFMKLRFDKNPEEITFQDQEIRIKK